MARVSTRSSNKELFDIQLEAVAALEAYSWPGNLRQLENVIQHAVLVSSGPMLLLSASAGRGAGAVAAGRCSEPLAVDPGICCIISGDLTERNVIQRALISNGYSRTRAADSLGISRVTLYKKMKKYGLMKPSATAAGL